MHDTPSVARQAAAYVLGRCRRFDAWSPQTLQKAIEKFSLDGRDTALCTRLCRSVLQNSELCDFYIGCYSSVPVGKLEPQVLDVLRLGVCQLLFLDRVPASAAVSEAVSQIRLSAPRAVGLVNAVLRRVAEHRDALPEVPGKGTAEYLSVRYSHPLWFCRRLLERQGYAFAERFLAANNEEPPLTVTMNTIKDRGKHGSVTLPRGGAVRDMPGYAEGAFFVQDAAAARAVEAAAPTPGQRVLDGCAAPGGKSFACAIRMENRGEIVACDLHEKKLALIDDGAQRLGIDILRTVPMDASKPYESFLQSFDLVLADVPCSGLGVIRRKPEIRYKEEASLSRLPEAQLRILRGLSRCVKPGGTLLYSTCTVLREENEEVIAAFLRENDDFSMETMTTLWPHIDGTDGFFICRLRYHA